MAISLYATATPETRICCCMRTKFWAVRSTPLSRDTLPRRVSKDTKPREFRGLAEVSATLSCPISCWAWPESDIFCYS